MTEPLLLASTAVRTFDGGRPLTQATGFFFTRGSALFLVTCRHVLHGEGHAPNRIEIDLHCDSCNLSRIHTESIWLYENGRARWRQGMDGGGPIDVAVLEIETQRLPPRGAWRSFGPEHLPGPRQHVEVGDAALVVGFPLGFHDTSHHLPVARQAIVASSFGVRFQGHGQFLTDARTHRGSSGSPVVLRDPQGDPGLPWTLIGIHSSSFDMGLRDLVQDEALGLNCAWYADILLTLTQPARSTLLA